MCLAVPGKIISVTEADASDPVGRVGVVDFQGSQVKVSLAAVPEAALGDWVLVHAGFAITRLEPQEARDTWEYLEFAEVGQTPPELREGDGAADTS
jgi:hydrogenase expression/formation protein HypC